MSIRSRRLRRDYEKVLAELAGSDLVQVEPLAGDPPYHYRITYRLNGIAWDEEKQDVYQRQEHVVEIYLPPGYPKQAPRCVMRTPIWHPNIGDYICIGDYWCAGLTLLDILCHIADMIQYKSFNLRSPVHKAAAVWAQRNLRSFPIGTRSVLPTPNGEEPAVETIPSHDDIQIILGTARYTR